MFDPESHDELKVEIAHCIAADRSVLDDLRTEIRPLRSEVQRIRPRTSTAISLVGTDGGNNQLQFDPFLIQLIRVVDSSNNEYCLEAITPTTDIRKLTGRQFDGKSGKPTALGKMMLYLGVQCLSALSPMIPKPESTKPRSPSWVQVYRELVEWATLFSIVREKEFGSDTLIVFDGLLRSKVFAKDLFKRYRDGLQEGIDRHASLRRFVYLAGVAKHSKVLDRYRLSMHLEGILTRDEPCYVEVPSDIEKKAYVWSEYARGDDQEGEGEINKFVGGKMFLVKFGSGKRDPIWPIDIFLSQVGDASTVLGHLLADAIAGFPVPHYPRCLQKAHENAALVDFDFDILQDSIYKGIRDALGDERHALDVFQLRDSDPAQRRYS